MKKLLVRQRAWGEFLTGQSIRLERPGTILKDFRLLLDFIGPNGVPTKSHQGNLPAAVLPELNARLSDPIEVFVDRALLRDYPNLAGLYVLLRVMGLAVADKNRVRIEPETRARWESLNATEQYFSLLEAWLLRASGEVLGGGQSFLRFRQFADNLRFLATQVSSRWKTFDELCHVYYSLDGIAPWNAQLHVRFGFLEVQPRPLAGRRQPSRAWGMEQARRTPWGEAVISTLLDFLEIRQPEDLLFLPEPAEVGFGYLQPAFQPYFPEWQQCFAPTEASAQKGVFTFKVTLDPRYHGTTAWYRLAVPHQADLSDLADAVLKAFEFADTDHLYEFRYRDQLGKTRVYNHPYTDEGPYSHEITLGETGLPLKETMRFRFDFGDDWRFLLRLEALEAPDPAIRRIRVLEAHGKNPSQYPDYEES